MCDASTILKPCYAWIGINEIDDETLLNNIDKLVDNSDGAGLGNFRWVPSNLSKRASLKYAPIKNPNN